MLSLAGAIGTADQTVTLNSAGSAQIGDFIQLDAEVMRVDAVQNGGRQYTVTRNMHGTGAAAHAVQTAVYTLANLTVITPFPAAFFGSPYSGSWSFPVAAPDIRVASAELSVTNARGNSTAASIYLTHNDDRGLRTLSGGQYSIQVEGHLAVDQSVAPAILVEASHAVRDVFAILGTASDATVQLQLNVDGSAYCSLSFAAGAIVSSSVAGVSLAPLLAGAKLTLSVLSVGQFYPGADLTVLVRL